MKKGFSLIEMIIVVGIISIFFGISLAYYHNFSNQKKLDTETQKLDDVIHLFQKKAIAGDIYTTCDNFTGYQIEFDSSDEYSAYFCCNYDCTDDDYKVQTYKLESPITYTYTPSNTLHFLPLTGRVDGDSKYTIDISYSTDCSRITIESSGLISTQNSCP